MSTLFALLFLMSLLLLIVGLIRPKLLSKISKTQSRKKLTLIFGLIALFCFIIVGVFAEPKQDDSQNIVAEDSETTIEISAIPDFSESDIFLVSNVVDGDTIDITMDDRTYRIRLIGVDTPETKHPSKPVECFGKEASEFTTSTLLNQSVTLEFDDSQGQIDKYDRLLCYIFLEDGTNFNELLISEGYAYEYTYNTPYKYQNDFKQAQQEAGSGKYGLWADGVCDENVDVIVEDTNMTSSDDFVEIPKETITEPTPPLEIEVDLCDCQSNLFNCSDFSTHAEAQEIFDCCYEQVGYDVHKLDRDGDGSACESL